MDSKDYGAILTRRKPRLTFALVDVELKRSADRQYFGSYFQLPPRLM